MIAFVPFLGDKVYEGLKSRADKFSIRCLVRKRAS